MFQLSPEFLSQVKSKLLQQLDISGCCVLLTSSVELINNLKNEFQEFETTSVYLEDSKNGFLFVAVDQNELMVIINGTMERSETELQLLLYQHLKQILPKDAQLKAPLLN